MTTTIRTRFAPSPTGYLHIGGARTALFNYLLARRLGGTFILRIEDTDQTRNIAGAERKLIDDLRWLGLDWDEGPDAGGDFGPYYQSQRLDLYRDAARRLLDAGQAYYAMETAEELDAMRKAAMQRGERGFRYPRPKSFPSEADAQKARDAGRPVVVRFAMPDRDFVIKDEILGNVDVGASELSDFVIVKADGWPTYHFAVVVDDGAMQITHVLRGQEHLLNSANHIGLQEALGLPTPAFAHLPIVLNKDGSKMSKREKDKVVRSAVAAALKDGRIDDARVLSLSGCADLDELANWRQEKIQLDSGSLQRLARELAVTIPEIDIHDFRVSGYLPEVLVNFIALLGWSAGDDREKYTLAELCAAFSLERINKSSAKFDREKLLSFNTDALTAADMNRNLAGLRDYLGVNEDSPLRALDDAMLTRLIEINVGVRTYRQLEEKCAGMFVSDKQLAYDQDAVKKWLLKGDAAGLRLLQEMRGELGSAADWTPAALEELIRGFAEKQGAGLGKVAQPIRIALTGSTISPPIFDTLAIVGRERSLARIDRLLVRLATGAP